MTIAEVAMFYNLFMGCELFFGWRNSKNPVTVDKNGIKFLKIAVFWDVTPCGS
jgi:hypothetical protein